MTYKQLAEELTSDEWNLGNMNGLAAYDFWTLAKTDTTGYDGHPYLYIDKCVNFERELWFELGKYMWRKHWSVYQDYMEYVRNGIVKHFIVKIFHYTKRVREMHDLAKYLLPVLMKGKSAMTANWSARNE